MPVSTFYAYNYICVFKWCFKVCILLGITIVIMISHFRITVLIVFITVAKADVDIAPRNIIAAARTDVRINCTVNSTEIVIWQTRSYGKDLGLSQPIHDGKQFVDSFKESGRFALDIKSRPGSHDLLISNVSLGDAGSFFCIGSTKEQSDVIVTDQFTCTEKNPASTLMGENVFGLWQSVLEIHCRLNFRGKQPIFCWSINDDRLPGAMSLPPEDCNSTTLSEKLNDVVAVKELHEAVIYVRVVLKSFYSDSDHCKFNSTNVEWKSQPLVIRFASLENHPAEECSDVDSSLMCNPPCTYEQKQRSDGSYYCDTNYTVDDKNYYLQVNSSCGPKSGTQHFAVTVAERVGLVVLFLAFIWKSWNNITGIISLLIDRMASFTRTHLMGVEEQATDPNSKISLTINDNDNQAHE